MMDMMKGMMKGAGKGKDGILAFKNDIKVFIGGLPQTASPDKEINKRLKQHMSQTGLNCLYAEVGRSQKGAAAFKTKEEVPLAVAALNGSNFEGHVLTVAAWGQKTV